jgi:L-arabinokinase
MGYAILALEAGATVEDLSYARQTGDKSGLPFEGYLANLNLSEFVQKRAHLLPETISGAEFLSFYRETADPYAVINPSATYAVRICTRHPIEENLRTRQFRLLLSSFSTVGQDEKEEALLVLGELMFGSHASYSLCGLGHPQTDQIVEMVRENLGKGVFGAKITGGGSGGTVCVLSVGEEGKETVNKIHSAYQEKLGRNVLLIKTK